MKNKVLYIIAIFLTTGFLSSCEKDDPEVEYTATYPVSGEWWVTYKVETSPGVFEDQGGGYSKLLTSNTSANTPDAIWVTDVTGEQVRDHGNFWTYKIKANVNMADKTFTANQSTSIATFDFEPYNINVNVTDGKVIENGGLSATKVKTDSIYFRAEYSDDPGTIYHVSGHRRTGFLEDEY